MLNNLGGFCVAMIAWLVTAMFVAGVIYAGLRRMQK